MASRTVRFLTNAFKEVFCGPVVMPAPHPRSSRRSPLRRKPLLEAMEQRLLLSADPIGALGADPTEVTEPVVSAPLVEETGAETAAPPVVAALPLAVSDEYLMQEDGVLEVAAPGVLANDTADGPLTAVLVSGPERGVLELHPDGSFSYTPQADDFGAVFFTYRAQITEGVGSEATVRISIDPVNDAPVAHGGDFDTPKDTALTIRFEKLASDVDGDTLEFLITKEPVNGTLEYTSVGIVYKPKQSFVGPTRSRTP
jgi:hypothetical protein